MWYVDIESCTSFRRNTRSIVPSLQLRLRTLEDATDAKIIILQKLIVDYRVSIFLADVQRTNRITFRLAIS